MKKLIFILALFASFVAAAQPGPVNRYYTRVRYWMSMNDSLAGVPNDTFNLRTPRAILYGWNNFEWTARKNNISYAWNVSLQRWEAIGAPTSQITIINDSSIQICNSNGVCDTFSVNINVSTIISTTIINDSTVIVCNNNSCDTTIINTPPGPPITTTTILNDSTIIVCSSNGCDTLIIHNTSPPITTTTIINDSTIEVCNAGGCDTLIINTNPVTTTTIINDSTIQVCDANGACDTLVINSVINNVTIINDTTVQVCGSDIEGPEEILNGTFTGSAGNWELGALWAYDNNDIVHSFGSTQATAQSGGLVAGATYRVNATITGTTGTVDVKLDAGTAQTYSAGAGNITFVGTWANANNYKIVLLPSNDFDGAIDNISVRRILPNCDTVQVPPTFTVDTIHIFVESPLHARNDSTFYMTRASFVDSGFLSDSDFTYFWHKVDSLYYHPSAAGVDTFLYDNGDSTGIAWYYNDVNPNSLISGGQVIPTGTPYVFNITPAIYRINGVRYSSPATQVTIDSADAALPRTDVFYVDSSGHASVLTGVAANPNLKPSIDIAWQLELTSVDLPAANPPAIVDSAIYNENVAPEWIPVTNVGTTTNPDNTLTGTAYSGSKSVDVTNFNAGDYILFTHAGGSFDLTNFLSTNGSFTGYILLKQAIPSTATLRAAFFNGGQQVSPLTNIPIVKNNITTYQGFSVPLTSFALTGNIVTSVRIQYVNTTTTNNSGFYLDNINLQSGIQPPVANSNALIRLARRGGTDSVMGTYQDGSVSFQFKDSSGIGGITADNGLSMSTATNVQLGSAAVSGAKLLHTSYIDVDAYELFVHTTGSSTLTMAITGDEQALGVSGNAVGAQFSATGIPVWIVASNSGASTVQNALLVARATFGSVSNGLGSSIDFQTATTTSSSGALANSIISKWTDVTHATRTSQLSITGVNSATTQTLVTIDGDGKATFLGPSSPTITVRAINTTNTAVQGESTSGTALVGTASSSGTGVGGVSSSGFAISGLTTSGSAAAFFQANPSSTNSVQVVEQLSRVTSGTAANGIGGSLRFSTETASGNGLTSNDLISSWTDATEATRTSQFKITGLFSASTVDLFTANGDGSWQIRPITATAASAITPQEGMFVFVSNTNGTFTSIGPWCYYNGAWHAL